MQYDKSLVAHKLLRWDKFITDYHLPEWNSIPDFGLYMDQVIVLLEGYLIHIQAEIRDSIPFREMIVRDIVVPPLQLVCQQLIIAMHAAPPVIQSGIIISADVASCKEKRYGSP